MTYVEPRFPPNEARLVRVDKRGRVVIPKDLRARGHGQEEAEAPCHGLAAGGASWTQQPSLTSRWGRIA